MVAPPRPQRLALVNASTWGLMLTGRVVRANSSRTPIPGHG